MYFENNFYLTHYFELLQIRIQMKVNLDEGISVFQMNSTALHGYRRSKLAEVFRGSSSSTESMEAGNITVTL